MKAIEDFTNVLQAIAEDKIISKDEIKKRLLSLADKMDRAGASNLEKLAYRAMSLIDKFPNNVSDVFNLLISCAKEDWIRVGEAARPLLDIENIRELSKKAGIKPNI